MGTPPAASNPARDLPVRNWTGAGAEKAIRTIAAQVDRESAKLWNISASDLIEIQRSLAELTS